MICKNCKNEISDLDVKCPYCGEENKTVLDEKNKNDKEEVAQEQSVEIVEDTSEERSDVPIKDNSDYTMKDDYSFVKSIGKVSFFAVPTFFVLLIIVIVLAPNYDNVSSLKILAICGGIMGILIYWQAIIGTITGIVSLVKSTKYKDKIEENCADAKTLNERKKNVMKGYIYGIIGLLAGIIALILISIDTSDVITYLGRNS